MKITIYGWSTNPTRHLSVQQTRALRRALTRRMAEIDAGPDDDTLALADRIIIELQRTDPKRRDAAS